ncbi:hypothetical protein NEF87_000091 [Candidatus Lokiarchaeum ossiferum]|uniref:DUF4064 domain-containing protein n=1 Tax=Candidatus Lokiarchaeum ossiferum TaxID=2951803 RepID=A0ABY6HK58_9ARCH|nr:hypothetical protein NEF87_000091 [Candidatus Lokiarchaeum sp. B-35]
MANNDLVKILAFIGGILGVVNGVMAFFGVLNPYSTLLRILFGILSILLGLMVIVSSGYIKISLPFSIPFEKVPLLIVGIVFLVFGSWFAGVLIIIAAILLFLNK